MISTKFLEILAIVLFFACLLVLGIRLSHASEHGYPYYYGFDNRSRGFTHQEPEYWENPNHVYPGEHRHRHGSYGSHEKRSHYE